VEEGELELLASDVDELEVSLEDFAVVSVVDSEDDLVSLVDLVSELSLLELLLFSTGGLGRP
jgi:hypothetical protein